ncbi:hypothetical protein AHF37_01510 [Paragonimus kellicotti]|nr:hypothetical protein AHF37_01510 [Paragonimus kellicotti]
MDESESRDDDSVDSDLVTRFMFHISRQPSETIIDDDARSVFGEMRNRSNVMVRKSAHYPWLIDAVDSDQFVRFYHTYIQLLCNVSETDYLTKPINQCVSNFIKLQMLVWNVTDKVYTLCFKLTLKEIPYYLFELLKLPSLHPCVCLTETNARLLAHSSIGVLHNIINHVPNIRSVYRRSGGVRALLPFVTASLDGSPDVDPQCAVHYLSLRTAALLLLSFLVDEDENATLHTNDSYIVYLLTALSDALVPVSNYSTKYGYQAEELLVGLQNLAGPDKNKKALIKNDAMKHIQTALVVACEMKFPYKPEDSTVKPAPFQGDPDALAEKALNFLWTLLFVPESHASLTPGSDFRRLVDKFGSDSTWSPSCRRVAQGIQWHLRTSMNVASGPSEISDQIAGMMSRERQQRHRHGHLMISYQHSNKNVMIKVRDQLTELGYRIWMDVDYIRGSFIDAMAQGIQEASGLILGLSQAFKNSPHCRQEVKYAYHLGIPFFPLQLEPNFTADGWLGLLLAAIIYISVPDESAVPGAVLQLKEQLGDIGHISRAASEEAVEYSRLLSGGSLTHSFPGFPLRSDSSVTNPKRFSLSNISAEKANRSPPPSEQNSNAVNLTPTDTNPLSLDARLGWVESSTKSLCAQLWTWKPEDVSRWLRREGLSAYEQALATVNGPMLAELARLRLAAPESVSVSLFRDLGMSLVDQLRLYSALAKLTVHCSSTSQAVP